MAAGTFSIALGIGFIMQNGNALASRFGGEETPEQPAPFLQEAPETAAQLPDDTLNSIDAEVTPIPVAQAGMLMAEAPEIAKPEPVTSAAIILPEAAKVPVEQEASVQLAALDPEDMPVVENDATAFAEVDCVPTMVAKADLAASVDLSVNAPCHVNAAFIIHHQGMMFTATTDDAGLANLIVPALAEVAVLIAAFEDGNGAVATVALPDFSSFDRAVLQWQGNTDVMLSAYEGDANFGDDNHIHIDNPGDMSRLESAEGGYLIRLGDETANNGLMAEVYTFPSGIVGTVADVVLVAEVQITDGNCGQELSAQSIQVSPTGKTSALDLTMVIPECDAIGDFLILQNMFEDLTLASR